MIRTVRCKCNQCNNYFESILTIANCCEECRDVRLVFRKPGSSDEWYINIRQRNVEAEKARLREEEQAYSFRITEVICEAY